MYNDIELGGLVDFDELMCEVGRGDRTLDDFERDLEDWQEVHTCYLSVPYLVNGDLWR